MATYNTKQEVFDAINDDGSISGVVTLGFGSLLFDQYGMDAINQILTDELVGGEYGFYLEDLGYELVGCNTEEQTIFVKVYGNASELLNELILAKDE